MTGILVLILFLLMVAVGGERGAIAVLVLCGNILVLGGTIILLAKGYPVFPVVFLAAVIISYISLMKQNGKNVKTFAAFAAVTGIMLVLSILIYLLVWKAQGGGLNEIQSMQEDIMYFYESDIHISMLQIAVSVTILSALGAAIDTALSVTSAVYEVKQHRPELCQKELFASGMQVGKEIIGTTVNTLLFVYLGDSMLLFAYLNKGGYTIETIVNSRFLFQELSVMLFGAVACVLIVPFAAYCVAYTLSNKSGLKKSKFLHKN